MQATEAKSPGIVPPFGRFIAAILAAACIARTDTSNAAVDLSSSAAIGYEYSSNPLGLTTANAQQLAPEGKKDLDDTSKTLTATAGAKIGSGGPIALQLQGMYSHSESDRFNKLGHDDYSFGGNLDWKPGGFFDAALSATTNRSPIRQADAGEEATQKTTTSSKADLRLRPIATWQISVTPSWSSSKIPLELTPDYEYRARALGLALGYLGAGRLIPGITVDRSLVTNKEVAGVARYKTESISGTLNYLATGHSSLTLSVGRSWRTIESTASTGLVAITDENRDSTFTGSLNYQRQLTVKTSFNVSAFRSFGQYDAGANLTEDTGFSAGAAWAATARIATTINCALAWSSIEDTVVEGATINRKDLVRSFGLGVNYRVSRRVALNSNVTRQIRNSTLGAAQFNLTSVGLRLSVELD